MDNVPIWLILIQALGEAFRSTFECQGESRAGLLAGHGDRNDDAGPPLELVGQCRLDRLAPTAEAALGHEFVDAVHELGVDREGDFCLGHAGMMTYHTSAV